MNKLNEFFKRLFNNIIEFFGDVIEMFLEFFGLWLIIGISCLFLYGIFKLGVNEYKKNYIMYTKISLTTDKLICDNHICILNTTVGKMTVSNEVAREINEFKDMKFDVGIMLGTCKHKLYAKIYTNDLTRPYAYVDLDEYSRGSNEQYKFYTEKFDIHPSLKQGDSC